MADLKITKFNTTYFGKDVKKRFISDLCHDVQVLRKQPCPTNGGWFFNKEFELVGVKYNECWTISLALKPDAINVLKCELFNCATGKKTTYCVGEPSIKWVLAPYKKAKENYRKNKCFYREYPDSEFTLPEFREFLKREVLKDN